jgi:hypothetical protein
MCTVTFLPSKNGFRLAMNRDESRTRARALPAALHLRDGLGLLQPREPGGGTWISANSQGAVFTLLNAYAVAYVPPAPRSSRGTVIPSICTLADAATVDARLRQDSQRALPPFRLVGFFAHAGEVMEWLWDGDGLKAQAHPWKPGQWSSSAFDEKRAGVERRILFEAALPGLLGDSGTSLSPLHRSHLPERGPWSVCMHREDARTVSLTEVRVDAETVRMTYVDGPPCRTAPGAELVLTRES